MAIVRTRFAPSPTGFLHVGGLRTALFAWLVARQAGGQFLLRIEDTDKAREVKGSVAHIIESLAWLGMDSDEEPYQQSRHLSNYTESAKKLIEQGRAYADIRSAEQLDDIRRQATAAKRPVLFRNQRPKNPPAWQPGMPLRFMSQPKAYNWHDAVMGDLATGPEVVDDFIILKSDGYPTYNFAHIVDDNAMNITHVIRSQEFLPSVPKYLNLYEALGLKPPIFATLPYVMGSDGKKKLSKRDGAKDVLAYKRLGYLPEAMINFLATLGWNDGSQQELFSVQQIIEKFDLSRVQKSGAKFDEQRLNWLNGAHIRQLSKAELYSRAQEFWPEQASDFAQTYKQQVLALVQDRLKFFAELRELSIFFFTDPPINTALINEHKQLKLLPKVTTKALLEQTIDSLRTIKFTPIEIQKSLNQLLAKTEQKPVVLFSLIRIATTWSPASPELAGSLSVLGKERVLARLKQAVAAI